MLLELFKIYWFIFFIFLVWMHMETDRKDFDCVCPRCSLKCNYLTLGGICQSCVEKELRSSYKALL